MRFNSLGNALMGVGGATGNISIDGVVPASLATVAGGSWGWLSDTVILGPADTGSGFKIYSVTLPAGSPSLVDSSSANNFAAGNGVWQAFLSGSGVRTNVGGFGPFPLAGPGDVSPQGLSVLVQNYQAGTGLSTFSAAGSSLSNTSVTLADSYVKAKDGIFTYRDSKGFHLRSLSSGTLQSYAPRTGETTFQCVPITVNGATYVVEAVGSGVSTLSIRPATSSNGYILGTGNTFNVDAVVVGSEVWIGWSINAGETPTALRIAALNLSTTAYRTGTTAGGSLVFTTQPDLTASNFTIGPVEGGTGSGSLKQPRYAMNDKTFTDARGMTTYQAWWDQIANAATGQIDAGRIVPPVPSEGAPSFGTVAVTGQTSVQAVTQGDAIQFIAGTGMTLTTDNTGKSVTFNAAGSWIPLVTGAEPPVFVTDGAGHLILVAYP